MYIVHKLPRELVAPNDPKRQKTVYDRMVQMEVPNARGLISVVRAPLPLW
jgi:hypothetical protein